MVHFKKVLHNDIDYLHSSMPSKLTIIDGTLFYANFTGGKQRPKQGHIASKWSSEILKPGLTLI